MPKRPELPLDEPIPPALDTPQFRDLWAEWLNPPPGARRGPRITPQSQRMALRKCLRWGHDAALLALEHSIEANYQGLFPAPSSPATTPAKTKPLSTWETKEKLAACQARLEALVNPGGSAYSRRLTGEEATEAARLRDRIRTLKQSLRE